jgi:hypothetical protein
MFCNSLCSISAFLLVMSSILASVSPPSISINGSWGGLGFCGERFTGIFADLRLETATKGEFEKIVDSELENADYYGGAA